MTRDAVSNGRCGFRKNVTGLRKGALFGMSIYFISKIYGGVNLTIRIIKDNKREHGQYERI